MRLFVYLLAWQMWEAQGWSWVVFGLIVLLDIGAQMARYSALDDHYRRTKS